MSSNGNAQGLTAPKNAKKVLAKKLRENPALGILVQPTIPGKIKAFQTTMNAKDVELNESYKKDPKAYTQWASDTLAIQLLIFNDFLKTVDPKKLYEDIATDEIKYIVWQMLTVMYTLLYEVKKVLPSSEFDIPSSNAIEILNTNIEINNKVGGMMGQIAAAAQPQRRAGMTVAEAAQLGQLQAQFEILQAQTRSVVDDINQGRDVKSVTYRFTLLKTLVGAAGTAAAIASIAWTGGGVLQRGVIETEQLGRSMFDTVEALWYNLPGTGINFYSQPAVPEFLYRAAFDYNSSIVDFGPLDFGDYSLADLRAQANAYNGFGRDVKVVLSSLQAKGSVGKTTILSTNLMKSIEESIAAAEADVTSSLAKTRFTLSPMRLLNLATGDSPDTTYQKALAKRDGLKRLKELKDSGNLLDLIYSEDTQYLNTKYRGEIDSIRSSGLMKNLEEVQENTEERKSNLASFITKKTNFNTGTTSYSIDEYRKFLSQMKAKVSTPASGIVQSYIDYEFSRVISPFGESFDGYLARVSNDLEATISSHNNEFQIIMDDAMFVNAKRQIQEVSSACTRANSQVSSSRVCETLSQPEMPPKLIKFLTFLQTKNLAIPPQIIQVLNPYLKDPASYPTLTGYQIRRLQARIVAEKNPNMWMQALFLLMSAGVGVFIVDRIEAIASIPANAIAIVASPLSAVAYLARAAELRGRAYYQAAQYQQQAAQLQQGMNMQRMLRNVAAAQGGPLLGNAPPPAQGPLLGNAAPVAPPAQGPLLGNAVVQAPPAQGVPLLGNAVPGAPPAGGRRRSKTSKKRHQQKKRKLTRRH